MKHEFKFKCLYRFIIIIKYCRDSQYMYFNKNTWMEKVLFGKINDIKLIESEKLITPMIQI